MRVQPHKAVLLSPLHMQLISPLQTFFPSPSCMQLCDEAAASLRLLLLAHARMREQLLGAALEAVAVAAEVGGEEEGRTLTTGSLKPHLQSKVWEGGGMRAALQAVERERSGG